MSGRHFEIQNFGTFAEVRDSRSTNKTFVNNIAIMTAKLQQGDSLRAGKTDFKLEWEKEVENVAMEVPERPIALEIEGQSAQPSSQSPIGASFGSFVPNTQPIRSHVEDEDAGIPLQYRSPIESVDATFEMSVEVEQQEYSVQPDSQVSAIQNIPAESLYSPFDELEVQQASLLRMQLADGRPGGHSLWDLISKLQIKQCIKIVAHFKKVRLTPPRTLRIDSAFKNISNSFEYLPVIVDGQEWLRGMDRSTTHRLAETDAIMFVICRQEETAVADVQEFGEKGVPGFSEAGGFLGWCWPSQWHLMCQALTDDQIRVIMGDNVIGMVYLWQSVVRAQVVPELKRELNDLGFAN